MVKLLDMTGKVCGRLTVLHRDGSGKDGKAKWACSCTCGNTVSVVGKKLRTGETKSCGCLRADTLANLSHRHGMFGTRIYNVWGSMIQRCYDSRNRNYKRYGGKGITVSDSWRKFDGFYADMGDGEAHLSLDRIDNSKGYSKENCRWATRVEQANNRSSNLWFFFEGREQTLASICEGSTTKKYRLTKGRLNRGWSLEDALNKPVDFSTQFKKGDRRGEQKRSSK